MIAIADIIDRVFSRNIDASHFKSEDVELALQRYVKPNLGAELYDAIVADQAAYADFISTFILQVVAYGVAVDKFEVIRLAITDRGIQAMLGEGMTLPQDTWLLKKQFALNRDKWIALMVEYAEGEYPEKFRAATYQASELSFFSQTKRTNHV